MMKPVILTIVLLVSFAASVPVARDVSNTVSSESKETEKIVIDKDFYPDIFKIYTGQYDIVNLFVPLNSLNFDEDSTKDAATEQVVIFFVEKDLQTGEDKGLYVRKDGVVTKLLEQGRDFATNTADNKLVYFAANDGIYVYKHEENKAEKYGSVTDDLIGIAVDNTTENIYVLTKDKQLFKVTEEGNKKVKIADVGNAEQIIMDYNNNLYYYNNEKQVYVVNSGGVKQIEGLPENPTAITILRPPFVIEDGTPIVIDDKAFIIYANGTSESTEFEFHDKPTAYSMEATLMHYYAYNKSIYEYNILAIILTEALNNLNSFFEDKKNDIQTIATYSRSNRMRTGA